MRWICLAILLFITLVARGAEPLLSKDQLAQIMGYPASKLIVRDDTAAARSLRGKWILSALRFSSTDDTFADVSLVVAGAGKLLTPKVQQGYDGLLAKFASKDPSLLRRIGAKEKYEGFVGFDGGGAGGEGYHALITIPSKNLDVEMIVVLDNDRPLKKTPETAAYYDSFLSGTPMASDHLTLCVERIVRNVFNGSLP